VSSPDRADSGLIMFGAAMCALAAMAGCALLAPSKSPAQVAAAEARTCYLSALKPILGDVAEPALAAIMAGGSPVQILRAHRVSFDDIAKTAERFSACAGEDTPPADAELSPESSPSLQDL
jgi:hypothetical protein